MSDPLVLTALTFTAGVKRHKKPGEAIPDAELLHASAPTPVGGGFTVRMEVYDPGEALDGFLCYCEWCPRKPNIADQRKVDEGLLCAMQRRVGAYMRAKWGHRYAEGVADAGEQ